MAVGRVRGNLTPNPFPSGKGNNRASEIVLYRFRTQIL